MKDYKMSADKLKKENHITESVYKCIFCSTMLYGHSMILKCLHLVCKNCFTKNNTDTGVQCLCFETTCEEFKDYSIVSPQISSIKVCCNNNCTNEVNTICSLCKSIYCIPCAKEHPCVIENKNADIIHSYAVINDISSCPNCKKKSVEVYCTKCFVMTCSLCYLSSHRNHEYEILENYGNAIKSNLTTQKLCLEQSNSYLEYCLEKTDDQIKHLELKKISIYDTIDNEMEILINEIQKRVNELKNSVDINVSKIVSAANENKNIFEDLRNKNKYYIALTESILNQGKPSDFVHLSKLVLGKTDIARNHTAVVSHKVSSIKIDLDFTYNNIEKCLSCIKEVGDVVPCKVLSVCNSNPSNEWSKNASQPCEKQVDESADKVMVDSDSDSDDDTEMMECCACNQWARILTQCISCKRCYHSSCHIPSFENNAILNNWTCYLCENITVYSKSFTDVCVTNDTPLTIPGKKVMERILLELFCKNEESDHFRECPARTDYPLYYEKVSNPISLNDIKTRLECDDSYAKILDVIRDLKQVFSNAMQYYSQFDPYYISAYTLQIYMNRMLTKWLPNIDFSKQKKN